jgi:transglutaminase-like putative cysteine protease
MVIFITSNSPKSSKSPHTAESGVSHYDILQSVKYNVEYNYTASGTQIGNYSYKIPRLNDRSPNSTLTQYCPPYQESDLLYNNNLSLTVSGGSAVEKVEYDRFNNTYNSVNISLEHFLDSFDLKLSQEYNITLNQISFSGISDSDIGTYDNSSLLYDLYCNTTDHYNMNTSDSDLINLVNNSGNPVGISESDNPIEKARKIINWISSNIEYEAQSENKGASWAYDNRKGDCSEYADLMITLLRIKGIPARKVTGLLVSNNPNFRPSVGEELVYTFSNSEDSIMGHAWMEYYVPNIGWIACDPTWHSHYDYFNQIDYLRFGLTVGSWMKDASGEGVSEFPFPMGYSNTNFDFELKLTILETNLLPLGPDMWEILFFTIISIAIVGALGVAAYIIYKALQRRKQRKISY